MIQPGIPLAGTVTVMGKLALPAAMELLLSLEAGVAHNVDKAASGGRNLGNTGIRTHAYGGRIVFRVSL